MKSRLKGENVEFSFGYVEFRMIMVCLSKDFIR